MHKKVLFTLSCHAPSGRIINVTIFATTSIILAFFISTISNSSRGASASSDAVYNFLYRVYQR